MMLDNNPDFVLDHPIGHGGKSTQEVLFCSRLSVWRADTSGLSIPPVLCVLRGWRALVASGAGARGSSICVLRYCCLGMCKESLKFVCLPLFFFFLINLVCIMHTPVPKTFPLHFHLAPAPVPVLPRVSCHGLPGPRAH